MSPRVEYASADALPVRRSPHDRARDLEDYAARKTTGEVSREDVHENPLSEGEFQATEEIKPGVRRLKREDKGKASGKPADVIPLRRPPSGPDRHSSPTK